MKKIYLALVILAGSVSAAQDTVILECPNGNLITNISHNGGSQEIIEFQISHQPSLQYLLAKGVILEADIQSNGHFRLKLSNYNGRDGQFVFRSYDTRFSATASYNSDSEGKRHLRYLQLSRRQYGQPTVNIDICY
jgi:hypothetical protein